MRFGWIEKCMACISNLETYVKVIVVDNASSDNTLEFLESSSFKFEIQIEKSNVNLGFGQANNLGIKIAVEENAGYLFLLNQDAYVYPDTIQNLIEVHERFPEYGILSPIHYNGDATALDRNFSLNYVSHDKNKGFYFDAINGDMKAVYKVPFVNAAAWLLPIKTIETIGGFDPIFFHYGEDDNYCQRAIYHRIRIGVVPKSLVRHDRWIKKDDKDQSAKNLINRRDISNKILWCNINNENYKGYIRKKEKNTTIKLLKNLLMLRIKLVNQVLEERRVVRDLKPKIEKSRNLNKLIGKHYLDE